MFPLTHRIFLLLLFMDFRVVNAEWCTIRNEEFKNLIKLPFHSWMTRFRSANPVSIIFDKDMNGGVKFGCWDGGNQCCYNPKTVCEASNRPALSVYMNELQLCDKDSMCKEGYICTDNHCCPRLSAFAKCPDNSHPNLYLSPCKDDSGCLKSKYCVQVFDYNSINPIVADYKPENGFRCCEFDCSKIPDGKSASFIEEKCESHSYMQSNGCVDFSKSGNDPFKKICTYPMTKIEIGVKIENPEEEIREIRFCDKMKPGPIKLVLIGSSVSSIDLEGVTLAKESKIKGNPLLDEEVLEKIRKMGVHDVQNKPEVNCSNLPPGIPAIKVEELCATYDGVLKSRGFVDFSMKGDDPLKEICNFDKITEIQIHVRIENPSQRIDKLKFCEKMGKSLIDPLSLTLTSTHVKEIDFAGVKLNPDSKIRDNPFLSESILKDMRQMGVQDVQQVNEFNCTSLPSGISASVVEERCSSHGGVLNSRGFVDFSMKGDDPLQGICNLTNVTEMQINVKIENPNQTIDKLKFCDQMKNNSVSLVLIGSNVKEIDWAGVNLSNDSKVRDNFLSESILEEIRKMGAHDVQQVNEINCASLPCEIPAFVVEEQCSSHHGTLKSIGYIDFSESGDDPLGKICNFSGITEIQIKIRIHRPSREMKTITFCEKMEDAGTSLILYGSHVKDLNVTIPLKSAFVHANKYLTNSSLHTFENDDDSADIQAEGECDVFGESDDLDDCEWVYGDLTLNSSYTQDESHKIKGFSGCLNLDKPGLNDSFFAHLEMNTSNESVSKVGRDCQGEHVISGTCITRILVKNLSLVLNSNISFNPASDCARVCTPYQLVVEKQDDCETVIGHIFLYGWYTAQDVKNFQAMKYLIGSITLDFTIPEDQKEGPLEFLDNLELIDSSNGGSPETDHSITLWNNLWMTELSLPKLKKVIHHYPNFMKIRGNGFKISEEEQLKLEAKLGGREFNPADLDTSNLVTELIEVEDWEVAETNCVECSSFWICVVLLVIVM